MANQVRVSSIDALEAFRANLIIFVTTARRVVDEVIDEVRRTRLWIQHDQRLYWEGQIRRWRKLLDQARQELLSARISDLRVTSSAQQNAVLKAKRALSEAEDKMRSVKKWNRDFDGKADPLTKSLAALRHFLDHDLPKAITFLVQAQRTLDAYTERTPSETLTAPAPAADAPGERETPDRIEECSGEMVRPKRFTFLRHERPRVRRQSVTGREGPLDPLAGDKGVVARRKEPGVRDGLSRSASLTCCAGHGCH